LSPAPPDHWPTTHATPTHNSSQWRGGV
jgi:hypothetical protein